MLLSGDTYASVSMYLHTVIYYQFNQQLSEQSPPELMTTALALGTVITVLGSRIPQHSQQ